MNVTEDGLSNWQSVRETCWSAYAEFMQGGKDLVIAVTLGDNEPLKVVCWTGVMALPRFVEQCL